MIETQVLIVGAGPVGIITGLLLNKLGVDFRIIERRDSLHNAPQAHVISGRSLEICRLVGIDDKTIRALGPSPKDTSAVRWADRLTGRDLGVFRMGADPGEIARMLSQTPTPTTNLSQDRFERVLFDKLSDEGCKDVLLFGHQWEGYDLEDNNYLSTVTGPDGETQISSKYLIGADGAGSRVRKAAGIEMIGPDNIQTFINIHFSADLREQLEGREALLYWIMDEVVSGTFIAHDIDSNWIFMKTVPADEDINPIDEQKFAGVLRNAIGADVPLKINSMNAWRMTAQIAERYQAGNLFLVGDAAHRFPPTGGIGMNTGFQDAHNLAWKIAITESGATSALLETYETERKPTAETNSSQSLTNAQKMLEVAVLLDVNGDKRITPDDLEAVFADEAQLEAVQRAVDAQAAHFNMSGLDLGVCYRSPAIVSDGEPPLAADPVSTYTPSTTPGTRLPHAVLLREGEKVSTLDLVPYDSFLVLTQQDKDGAIAAAVQTASNNGMPLQLQVINEAAGFSPADDAFDNLFPVDEVLLIRPDGHIGARLHVDHAHSELAAAMKTLLQV